MDNINKFQQPGRSKIINGSILAPETSGLCLVLSINNLEGKPEGNPLLPLFDKKWKKVREESRGWYALRTGAYKLGALNTLAVQSDVEIMMMLCQDANLKVDLKSLEACLQKVCAAAKKERGSSIHVSSVLVDAIPELTELCKKYFIEQGISVYFYQEKSE